MTTGSAQKIITVKFYWSVKVTVKFNSNAENILFNV